ncbi:hypothetical protein MP228_007640 [Amoeboaphelidium protococcarum]|nr:hypothetical protein MP228_007640 [Amoeboaphelidium protococcarum]
MPGVDNSGKTLPQGCSQVYDSASGRLVGTVQGLRKFGYYQDRDAVPYGDYACADSVYAIIKENGKNALVSAFQHDDTHLPCRLLAGFVGMRLRISRNGWLIISLLPAGEAFFKESRHLVDYGDVEDHIRFFAVTQSVTMDVDEFGLTALSPLEFSKVFIERFKLKVAQQYRVMSCKDLIK